MRAPVHHGKPKRGCLPGILTGPLLTGMAFALLVLARPPVARAFDQAGHRVVGHIAERHLCADTRSALEPLLDGSSLAEAGLWPDRIRGREEWAHTNPWHYINVSDRGSVAREARRSPDNVLAALARFEAEAVDQRLGRRQRSEAVRFVAHFVADLHQPLHVGRAADRGGNRIPVSVSGRLSNLHEVWDGGPLRRSTDPSPRDRVRRLPLAPAQVISQWQQAVPLDWARESQALRPQVYAFGGAFSRRGAGPFALPESYLEAARTLLDQRLHSAGVRLAGRLNALFAGSTGVAGACAGEVASERTKL